MKQVIMRLQRMFRWSFNEVAVYAQMKHVVMRSQFH